MKLNGDIKMKSLATENEGQPTCKSFCLHHYEKSNRISSHPKQTYNTDVLPNQVLPDKFHRAGFVHNHAKGHSFLLKSF